MSANEGHPDTTERLNNFLRKFASRRVSGSSMRSSITVRSRRGDICARIAQLIIRVGDTLLYDAPMEYIERHIGEETASLLTEPKNRTYLIEFTRQDAIPRCRALRGIDKALGIVGDFPNPNSPWPPTTPDGWIRCINETYELAVHEDPLFFRMAKLIGQTISSNPEALYDDPDDPSSLSPILSQLLKSIKDWSSIPQKYASAELRRSAFQEQVLRRAINDNALYSSPFASIATKVDTIARFPVTGVLGLVHKTTPRPRPMNPLNRLSAQRPTSPPPPPPPSSPISMTPPLPPACSSPTYPTSPITDCAFCQKLMRSSHDQIVHLVDGIWYLKTNVRKTGHNIKPGLIHLNEASLKMVYDIFQDSLLLTKAKRIWSEYGVPPSSIIYQRTRDMEPSYNCLLLATKKDPQNLIFKSCWVREVSIILGKKLSKCIQLKPTRTPRGAGDASTSDTSLSGTSGRTSGTTTSSTATSSDDMTYAKFCQEINSHIKRGLFQPTEVHQRILDKVSRAVLPKYVEKIYINKDSQKYFRALFTEYGKRSGSSDIASDGASPRDRPQDAFIKARNELTEKIKKIVSDYWYECTRLLLKNNELSVPSDFKIESIDGRAKESFIRLSADILNFSTRYQWAEEIKEEPEEEETSNYL